MWQISTLSLLLPESGVGGVGVAVGSSGCGVDVGVGGAGGFSHGPMWAPWPMWPPSAATLGKVSVFSAGVPGLWQIVTGSTLPGVGVMVTVGVAVAVGVTVIVGVGVAVLVGVRVTVGVTVTVGVMVTVGVIVTVGVMVTVAVTSADGPIDWIWALNQSKETSRFGPREIDRPSGNVNLALAILPVRIR